MQHKINLKRNDDNKLFLLGAYQIGGGIYGVIMTLFLLADFQYFIIGKILIAIFGIALFLFSVFCGYLLIKRQFLKGLNLSIYNTAFQVIGFGVAGYHFKYVSGFFAGITLDLTRDIYAGIGFDFSIIDLALGSSSESLYLTINVLAILILGFIFKMKEKMENKISSIANSI